MVKILAKLTETKPIEVLGVSREVRSVRNGAVEELFFWCDGGGYDTVGCVNFMLSSKPNG